LYEHLHDNVDVGYQLAFRLGMTPASYCQACGRFVDPHNPDNLIPAGWLGGMLLKVLRDPEPKTRDGRLYSPQEIEFFWQAAQGLAEVLEPRLRTALQSQEARLALWYAVRNWAGRRPVFTLTGRLRANATYCSSRNCVFQGPAADGAILGMWKIWRAGYQLVNFVHDQVVVESPADDQVAGRVAHVEALMKQGMLEVVPGMLVNVETVITRSLHKKDLDPRYDHKTKEKILDCTALAG
jgi:hypothetical protein